MQALSTDVEIEVKCHKNYSHRVIFQIALLSIWPLNLDICIQTKGASELQTYFGDNLCCKKWTYGWDQKIVGLQPLTITVMPKMVQ